MWRKLCKELKWFAKASFRYSAPEILFDECSFCYFVNEHVYKLMKLFLWIRFIVKYAYVACLNAVVLFLVNL